MQAICLLKTRHNTVITILFRSSFDFREQLGYVSSRSGKEGPQQTGEEGCE